MVVGIASTMEIQLRSQPRHCQHILAVAAVVDASEMKMSHWLCLNFGYPVGLQGAETEYAAAEAAKDVASEESKKTH